MKQSTARPDSGRRIRRAIAREGAEIGVRMTRLYAGAFMLYATYRLAIAIAECPSSDTPIAATIAAAAASMVVASVTITSILALVSMVVGAASALIVHWLLARAAARGARGRPIVVGASVALVSLVIGQIGLLPALGFSLLSLPATTYLFWVGLPSALYLVVTTWVARPSWRYGTR